MSKIKELSELGQSIWYDYIRRPFITSGELGKLIGEGLRGETSNPTILEKAIAGSADYDSELKKLAQNNKSVEEIYEKLVFKDITLAADLFTSVYEETNGLDGYVSIEVNPKLAHDTKGTVEEAKRYFSIINRPNIMIKVPATQAGISAIYELISSGINVNVTLMFNMRHYISVSEAYIKGLERLADHGPSVPKGHTVDKVSSVASFFVSRVDTVVDTELDKIGNQDLKGKIAIANAKAVYAKFKDTFSSHRWEKLSDKGARVQRVLWASTGTKNPLYSDTLYVDELIGPDTVNTVPPDTYQCFRNHGTVSITLTKDIEEEYKNLDNLAKLGIDLEAITEKLQKEGIESFYNSFKNLLISIEQKRSRLISNKSDCSAELAKYGSDVNRAMQTLKQENIMRRIWSYDHTLWKESPEEITNRLGWLRIPERMVEVIPSINSFVDNVRAAGYTNAVLLGMGGSSLAPEVFRLIFGVKDGYLNLSVLDSTDPGAVLECRRSVDLSETLFIVSTKSGGTVETISFMKYFYNEVLNTVGAEEVGKHFIAITDPSSSLESVARELNFRKIFLNDPNIGGRYSALSYFGLIPAALIGVDIETLLDRALKLLYNNDSCNCPVNGDNSGAWLGSILGVLANSGRDKLTIISSPPIVGIGAWIEQLIAESTGKNGTGILPVYGEQSISFVSYASDRLFVYLRLQNDDTYDQSVRELVDSAHPVVRINLSDIYDIGGEFFRWEMAVAVAGMFLGVNPFDQPDVESSKILAKKMVATYKERGNLPELKPTLTKDCIKVYSDFKVKDISDSIPTFLYLANIGNNGTAGRSYVSLQAYVKPTPETQAALEKLRTRIQKTYRLATTIGYGPRFLHSTGQLHKGDAGNGLFIQFLADIPEDLTIPEQPGLYSSSITFGILRNAQALGDRQALIDNGRNVITFDLGKDIAQSLEILTRSLG